jgi:hypothetical protein
VALNRGPLSGLLDLRIAFFVPSPEMPALHSDWIVAEHGPVETVADGILTVEGTIKMPLGRFPRRMTIVRLAAGGTAIWSAIPLDDVSMSRIEAEGEPRYLIVPNAHHRLDIRAYKSRYPDALVLAPDGARKAVEEACSVDGNQQSLRDPQAELLVVAGTGDGELALRVSRSDGTILIVNDIIAHVAHPPGVMAGIMARLMGFGVRKPQIPRIVERSLVKNRNALARQLSEWAKDERLQRIIPSHGAIIASPREVLSKLAHYLRRR